MSNHLLIEFNKFAKNRRSVKKILNNTYNAIQDIARSHYFTDDQLSDIGFKSDEEHKIRSVIENPVGIIVLGLKSWAKATIVNELLNFQLLPISDESEKDKNWRTVRIMYGPQGHVSLSVANCFELVDRLSYTNFANFGNLTEKSDFVNKADLELREPRETEDPGYFTATLEIKLPHQLLDDDVQIILAPSTGHFVSFESVYSSCFEGVTPIVLYALSEGDTLSPQEVDELMELKKLSCKTPVYFVKVQKNSAPLRQFADVANASELTESQQHLYQKYHNECMVNTQCSPSSSYTTPSPLSQSPPSGCEESSLATHSKVRICPSSQQDRPKERYVEQLSSLGFIPENEPVKETPSSAIFTPRSKLKQKASLYQNEAKSVLSIGFPDYKSLVHFCRKVLQSFLVDASTLLHQIHNRCLRMFILTAFDMTRDMMITPKRIEYAKQKEQQLFDSLMAIANKKQDELRTLILDTLNSMRNDLIEDAAKYKFKFNPSLNVELDWETSFAQLPAPLAPAGSELRSPSRISTSSRSSSGSSACETPRASSRDVQLAMAEIQDHVLNTLNSAIAGKLIGSVDYLRDSYVGTLERCLLSLEKTGQEVGESVPASNALKQILNAAYQVEINMKTTSSFLRAFWEKMKQLVATSLSWRNPPIIDREWKRKIATDVLSTLSEWRLAKSICSQFKERLRLSHDQFAAAMRQLENIHFGRLEKTEEQRIRVRKYYAPRIARYALESTSLRDLILFGMPQLGREIGRGQYGVVYACDSWAGHSPVAVKSVVPPDDKHWNDLA
ncbi:dual serine/threonine and tyrosine protein kinase-like protein, partial [Leptotrombidium deliense]